MAAPGPTGLAAPCWALALHSLHDPARGWTSGLPPSRRDIHVPESRRDRCRLAAGLNRATGTPPASVHSCTALLRKFGDCNFPARQRALVMRHTSRALLRKSAAACPSARLPLVPWPESE